MYDAWLRQQSFDTRAPRMASESDYDAVRAVAGRRDRPDTAIAELAADSDFTTLVRRLGCLRGVSMLTSFGLAVDIGDRDRFTGDSIGSSIGLVAQRALLGRVAGQGSPGTKPDGRLTPCS